MSLYDAGGPVAPPGCRFAAELRPGDRYLFQTTRALGETDDGLWLITGYFEVEVLYGPEAYTATEPPETGLPRIRFHIREPRTRREGTRIFGPAGIVRTELTHYSQIMVEPT